MKVLYWFIALLFRLYAKTWRVHRQADCQWENIITEGAVVASLHGDLLPLLLTHRQYGISPLVSWSKDGEMLTRVLHHLGYDPIRGSSSRGGKEALEEASKRLSQGHSVGFTIDGPRGPIGVAKPGAVRLAQSTHKKLLLLSCVAYPCVYLSSWDKFSIPFPFAKLQLRYEKFLFPFPTVQENVVELSQGLQRLSISGDRPLDD